MKKSLGTTGLILNEPLLWERGKKGRYGFSIPRRDVEPCPLDEDLTGEGPNFPDLSEVDIVRHYTRLSTWNFGVDTGTYPLGSCTMKYNPKTNEKQAALAGFAGAHPLLPSSLSQGVLRMLYELEGLLAEITGMDAVSLQPARHQGGGCSLPPRLEPEPQLRGQTLRGRDRPRTSRGKRIPVAEPLLRDSPVAAHPGASFPHKTGVERRG